MPSNDAEVFDHLTSDQNTSAEIDYLAYAMFALRKANWIDHFKTRHDGTAPTPAEIDAWIGELTDYDFATIRGEAADFFHLSAEEHLHDYIEDQKKSAVNASILSEVQTTMTRVRAFTSPWKHLGIVLLMAIVAPVILGGVLFLFGVFDKTFPVHVTVTSTAEGSAKIPPAAVPGSQ
jgi:hypothetical protein